MTIKRNSTGSLDTADQKKAIVYCSRCEEFGLQRKLGERKYLPDEFGNYSIPADHDQWLQCYYCGTLYPKHEVKEESIIEPFVTISENPFEALSSKIEGVDSGRQGRGTVYQRKRKDQYKDDDVNRLIRQGGKVIPYSET